MLNISEAQFEEIVGEAVDALPEKYFNKLNNVAITASDFPSGEQMRKTNTSNKYGLLGLYEGYIQSSRKNLGVVTPDKITIFRMPILQSCSNVEECRNRVLSTLKHEIAHHFGSDEKGARKASKH